MTAYEIILGKRSGGELSAPDIEFMVEGFLDGRVADYQMSAFLMAVFFVGMSPEETVTLTRTMLRSGAVHDLSGVSGPKVDKHSTGGVGDKLSLIIAPVAAACGVRVPMISGRALGHTGGTLDKLESIPGFRTDLSSDAFVRIVDDVGMGIIGQSPEVVPADRRMYALRDVTATIECVPLIVSSILSKKLASDLDALVLDVKVGRGAFMRDIAAARELARRLIDTSHRLGLPARALVTDMESPLGLTVGNALEVAEAVSVLRGAGPEDVRETSLELAGAMVELAGLERDRARALQRAETVLSDGRALDVFLGFVEAQGGDPEALSQAGGLPEAPVRLDVLSDATGVVEAIDALEVGLVSVALGAGRRTIDEDIDPSVGIEIVHQIGGDVRAGDVLAVIHARTRGDAESVARRLGEAFSVGEGIGVAAGRRVIETIA